MDEVTQPGETNVFNVAMRAEAASRARVTKLLLNWMSLQMLDPRDSGGQLLASFPLIDSAYRQLLFLLGAPLSAELLDRRLATIESVNVDIRTCEDALAEGLTRYANVDQESIRATLWREASDQSEGPWLAGPSLYAMAQPTYDRMRRRW